MTDEKAREYQEVAALVCLDLDALLEIAATPGITARELAEQIRYTHERKEELISSPTARERRYRAACSHRRRAAADRERKMNPYKTCIDCGESFRIDEEELADGTYSPRCTDCLRKACESNGAIEPVPERIVPELN